MRALMGWLMFLLTVAFAMCVIAVLIANTWRGFSAARSVVGFFAFGIPSMAIGGATAMLWDGRRSLQNVLGWAGTMAGIACGIAVLLLVGGWVLSDRTDAIAGALKWRLAGFGVCGVVYGGFGITMLIEADKKAT